MITKNLFVQTIKLKRQSGPAYYPTNQCSSLPNNLTVKTDDTFFNTIDVAFQSDCKVLLPNGSFPQTIEFVELPNDLKRQTFKDNFYRQA